MANDHTSIPDKHARSDDANNSASPRPVVLVFTRYYLPGYRAGGPIRTIANIVERLGDKFDFRIIASDRDVGTQSPYPDVERGRWMKRGKALVRYISVDRFGLSDVARIVRSTPHDVIYLNSFFDPRFTQQVLLNSRFRRLSGRPVVLAPRGEFSNGALMIKRWKKAIFLRVAKLIRLYEGLVWQASSAHEAQDVQRVLSIGEPDGLRGRLVVTGHLASVSGKQFAGQSTVLGNHGQRLRVCFLSRVSPMKNLDFALRALQLVDVPVHFSIYGPIEDKAYWHQCRDLISKLPPHIEVKYKGEVEHPLVIEKLAEYDLFFLPTRGENFGHVIHEALRAGLPILVSNQTPWRNLAKAGVGWDLALENPSAFARQIEAVSKWTPQQRGEVADSCREYAARIGNDVATVVAHEALFLDAIARRT